MAVALAAGFFLIERTHLLAFQVRRSDAQRVIFLSTVAALTLMLGARVFLATLSNLWPSAHDFARAVWFWVMPKNTPPWLGTAALALIATAALPWWVNRRWPKPDANRRAIRDFGSNLEKLMVRAFDRQLPIAVTLKSRKVYVGRIVSIPPLLDIPKPSDLRVLPYISGYRREDDFGYAFTTGYAAVYAKVVKANRKDPRDPFGRLDLDDFEIVIPLSEVTTAHLFDRALYDQHGGLFSLSAPSEPSPPGASAATSEEIGIGDELFVMSSPGYFRVVEVDGETLTIENKQGIRKHVHVQAARKRDPAT